MFCHFSIYIAYDFRVMHTYSKNLDNAEEYEEESKIAFNISTQR